MMTPLAEFDERGRAIVETARQISPGYFADATDRASRIVFAADATDAEAFAAIVALIDELADQIRSRTQ